MHPQRLKNPKTEINKPFCFNYSAAVSSMNRLPSLASNTSQSRSTQSAGGEKSLAKLVVTAIDQNGPGKCPFCGQTVGTGSMRRHIGMTSTHMRTWVDTLRRHKLKGMKLAAYLHYMGAVGRSRWGKRKNCTLSESALEEYKHLVQDMPTLHCDAAVALEPGR